jgi:DNA gyrase subunit A
MTQIPAHEMTGNNVIEYALMVNLGRAMPRITDGLKVVHRRILLAARPFRRPVKSAKVVGDTMGEYHPHGDSSIYEALARMTQSFVTFTPLLRGEGSWGTIDGDPPAAMRYTEVSIGDIGLSMMSELQYDPVDKIATFDNLNTEPVELPVPFPYIFIAGSYGIAVGFTNSIPTHHPGDVCRALRAKLLNPDLTHCELFELMPPAFPTGGIITNTSEVREAYEKGQGMISIASNLVVTDVGIEIRGVPYYTTTSALMASIRAACEGKTPKIPEINEIHMIADATVLVTLKRGSDANSVIQRLYKHTECLKTKPLKFAAVTPSNQIQPNYNPLYMMSEWIWWRHCVKTRIHRNQSYKIRNDIHIRQGIVAILRIGPKLFANILTTADNEDTARQEIKRVFELDDVQCNHVLQLPTRSLIRQNLDSLLQEIASLQTLLAHHEDRLLNPALVTGDMIRETEEWIQYFDRISPPNTTIYQDWGTTNILDVPLEETLIIITNNHYIRRIEHVLAQQRRGGKGSNIGTFMEDDAPKSIHHATTHDVLLFFTSYGRLFVKNVYDIPLQNKNNKPIPLHAMLRLTEGETVCKCVIANREWTSNPNTYLVMATAGGIVKKVKCEDFKNTNISGIRAINIVRGDWLIGADLLDPSQYNSIMLSCRGDVNATGAMCIRFAHEDIRCSGRISSGVVGMNIDPTARQDSVISMSLTPAQSTDHFVMTVSSDGYSKLTILDEYDTQGRGGKGRILAAKRPGSHIVGSQLVKLDELAIVISTNRMIMTPIEQINKQGRVTIGVKIMDLAPGETVVAFTTINNI